MIKVEAAYAYHYDTQAELDWIIASLPEDADPIIDRLLKRVTYKAVQQA